MGSASHGTGSASLRVTYHRSGYAQRCAANSRESPPPSWSVDRWLVSHRSDCVGHPDEDVGVLEDERAKRSELEAHLYVCVGLLEVLGLYPCERGGMPYPFGGNAPPLRSDALPLRSDAPPFRSDARRERRGAIGSAYRSPTPGSDAQIEPRDAPREGRVLVHPFLAMHCPFRAMLHAFVATPFEGEDAIHEESHGHRALHRVPDLLRERGSEYVGSSSERETMRPGYVGMPREPKKSSLDTRHVRTVSNARRSPRRHDEHIEPVAVVAGTHASLECHSCP
jgi:hypothetical protein